MEFSESHKLKIATAKKKWWDSLSSGQRKKELNKSPVLQKKFVLTKAKLCKYYVTEGLSTTDIGAIVGCHAMTICRLMSEFGIPKRNYDERSNTELRKNKISKGLKGRTKCKFTKEELIHKYHELGMSLSDIAKEHGCSAPLVFNFFKTYNIKTRTYKESCNMPKRISKLSESRKDWWQKLTEQERVDYLKSMYKWVARKPTKLELAMEKILDILYPNEWKYIGDGQVIIAEKNPDFICINGEKLIIEIYGEHWHKGQDPKDREKIFEKYGYRTLVIWDNELKNIESVVRKIIEFTGQGLTNCKKSANNMP